MKTAGKPAETVNYGKISLKLRRNPGMVRE